MIQFKIGCHVRVCLMQALEARQLSKTGRKAALVARLEEALRDEQTEAEEEMRAVQQEQEQAGEEDDEEQEQEQTSAREQRRRRWDQAQQQSSRA